MLKSDEFGYNASYILENKIGLYADLQSNLSKFGDVIPKVKTVIKSVFGTENDFPLINYCERK